MIKQRSVRVLQLGSAHHAGGEAVGANKLFTIDHLTLH